MWRHLLSLGALRVLLHHAVLFALPLRLKLVVRPAKVRQLKRRELLNVFRANWVRTEVARIQSLRKGGVSGEGGGDTKLLQAIGWVPASPRLFGLSMEGQ